MNRVSVAARFVRWLNLEYHVSVKDIDAIISDPRRMRAIATIIRRDSPLLDQRVMLLPGSLRFRKCILRAGGVPRPDAKTSTTLREILPLLTLDSLRTARNCCPEIIVDILLFMKERQIDVPRDPYKKLCQLMKQNNPSPADMILFLQKT